MVENCRKEGCNWNKNEWKKGDGSNRSSNHTALQPAPVSSIRLSTPTCWYRYWSLPHPLSPSSPPHPKKSINKMEDERGTIQSWYNYPISICSHPSFLPLHSSFSPSQLSLPLSPARPPLCSCLFRLGWDKWERMNTLGTQGSRRAECEGQGEARGGGGVTWTRRDWPARKIKPSRWWRVMNGSHYEWFGERGAGGEEVWKGGSSDGMAEEEQMMLDVSCKKKILKKEEKRGLLQYPGCNGRVKGSAHSK